MTEVAPRAADNTALLNATQGDVHQAPPRQQSVGDLVQSMQGEFAKALPKTVPVDQFMRIVMTEMRQNPTLATCTPASLFGALLNSARLGLMPGGLTGEFYLTPRRVKGEMSVVGIIGYKGLIALAFRAGVKSIKAEIVYENDHWDEGIDSERGAWFEFKKARGERGREIGVLAVAKLPSDEHVYEFTSMAKVESRKARGSAGDRGPWASDRDAMICKTGIRALFASGQIPISTEQMALANRTDEAIVTYTKGLEEPEIQEVAA